jgi:glyceraldehyde-3-phosphate dehydrogenase (NADP+)
MSTEKRIESMEKFVELLKKKRQDIINILVWEICKNTADATAEFDRTMAFIEMTIKAMKDLIVANQGWRVISGITATVKRVAIGIMMCLGPFNYPFNETYATLIPALLAGNVVIMKLPSLGGLAHILTIEAFKEAFPPGVINFVSGSGRATMGPIMVR